MMGLELYNNNWNNIDYMFNRITQLLYDIATITTIFANWITRTFLFIHFFSISWISFLLYATFYSLSLFLYFYSFSSQQPRNSRLSENFSFNFNFLFIFNAKGFSSYSLTFHSRHQHHHLIHSFFFEYMWVNKINFNNM